MKEFNGFPTKAQFTPLPNILFSEVLPQISDIAELKITLYIFHCLYQKRGFPRFASFKEMLGNQGLINSIKQANKSPEEGLRHALNLAVRRGTILRLELDRAGQPEEIYFVNTARDRKTMTAIQNGTIEISGLKTGEQPPVDTGEPPNIFAAYEQNIGMLTPMIAEELRAAEKLYPASWIQDAMKEAVSLNKRNWRYISKILENWAAQGKQDGTYSRDYKKTEPDKYIKGKYGHMVRR